MNESQRAIESVVLETLRRGDRTSIVVAGTSMEPWIRQGDRVWLEPLARGELSFRVGDVVLIADDRIRQLHRIIGIDGAGFVVKGDACDGGALRVAPSLVLGRATSLERRGRSVPFRRLAGRVIAACSPYSRFYHRPLMLVVRFYRRATF
ncbi:MAG: S24/S26 family peptidase [Deltaproteobacteria bacterium]|nr:S24/S26 family peptidase [Deltaproteobacteria bacterium]